MVRNQASSGQLDALNFFLADVRDGLGPYLAIYLLTEQKWDEASIGVVMSVAAIAGIIAQTPAGALIDLDGEACIDGGGGHPGHPFLHRLAADPPV
jgi:hypothetical protein